MLYNVLKRVIKRKNYIKKEMLEKINILFESNQLSQGEYEELIMLMREEEENK
jgi:hypothetical protein